MLPIDLSIDKVRLCTGMNTEGIFRVSPSAAVVRTIKEAYDRGHPMTLSRYDYSGPEGSQTLAASLLKSFLRELPSPLVREEDYSLIDKCPSIKETDFDGSGMEAVEYIRDKFLPALAERESGSCEVVLLAAVLELLHDISLRSGQSSSFNYQIR